MIEISTQTSVRLSFKEQQKKCTHTVIQITSAANAFASKIEYIGYEAVV